MIMIINECSQELNLDGSTDIGRSNTFVRFGTLTLLLCVSFNGIYQGPKHKLFESS